MNHNFVRMMFFGILTLFNYDSMLHVSDYRPFFAALTLICGLFFVAAYWFAVGDTNERE